MKIVSRIVRVVLALAIGYWLATAFFDKPIWQNVFCGIFTVLAFAVLTWITYSIEALKDPDVQIASQLRIPIKRYRRYQRLFDEYQEFLLKNGSGTRASEEKFKEIFEQIDNPNEWRRYSAYREEKQRKEFLELARKGI